MSAHGVGISRRRMLQTSLAAASVLSLEQFLVRDAYAQVRRVRSALETVEGKRNLALYRKGVEIMRGTTLPAHNPLSWTFQANIHDYPATTDPDALFPGRRRNAQIQKHYELAYGGGGRKGIWRTCSHFHDENPANIHFLTWHRMYLYFFERAIEKLVGEPFALPYWNYTNPAQRRMPSDFVRSKTGGKRNFLYYPARQDDFIDQGLPADTVRTRDAFLEQRFLHPTRGFNSELEIRPHNVIHGAIGTLEGMGDTPKAARDPLFWVHHCNIDRLWESWREPDSNDRSGKDPTSPPSYLAKPFDFAGPNGERISMTVADVLKTRNKLNVSYDHAEPLPVQGGLSFAERAEVQVAATQLSKSSGSGTLTKKGEQTTLEIKPSVSDQVSLGFTNNPNSFYSLVIDVEVSSQPGALYEVYIDALKNAAGPETEKVKVDTFSMFGAGHGQHAEHAGAKIRQQWRGDVTALVQQGLVDPKKPSKVTVKVIYGDPASAVSIVNAAIEAE